MEEPMSDPVGNEQIDNYLRQALNIAWVELDGPKERVRLSKAIDYVAHRLLRITSWPDSPQPETFPFVQKSGNQPGE
jgi:hypothetical protein